MSRFAPATRKQARARVSIDGPSGGGKTLTALRLAFLLGNRVAGIDTEFGSMSKYVGDTIDDEGPFNFQVVELKTFSPAAYVDLIRDAERGPFDVLIIDSLSHAWVGQGGILDQKDHMTGGWSDWAKLSPQQRQLVDTILASPLNIIATMRTKTEWTHEEYVDHKSGKTKHKPVKIGLQPIQREGIEYEFDLIIHMDQDNLARVTKSRCPAMTGLTASKPGVGFFRPFVEWLSVGTPMQVRPVPAEAKTEPPSQAPSANGNGVAESQYPAEPAAGDDQVNRIEMLRTQLGISDADWQAGLIERYGKQSSYQLTVAQATRIEANLEASFKKETAS